MEQNIAPATPVFKFLDFWLWNINRPQMEHEFLSAHVPMDARPSDHERFQHVEIASEHEMPGLRGGRQVFY